MRKKKKRFTGKHFLKKLEKQKITIIHFSSKSEPAEPPEPAHTDNGVFLKHQNTSNVFQ